jgi:hypothetical protein
VAKWFILSSLVCAWNAWAVVNGLITGKPDWVALNAAEAVFFALISIAYAIKMSKQP